jgi:hypothetical protein
MNPSPGTGRLHDEEPNWEMRCPRMKCPRSIRMNGKRDAPE